MYSIMFTSGTITEKCFYILKWKHRITTRRVVELCKNIGSGEHVDLSVLPREI